MECLDGNGNCVHNLILYTTYSGTRQLNIETLCEKWNYHFYRMKTMRNCEMNTLNKLFYYVLYIMYYVLRIIVIHMFVILVREIIVEMQ